MACCKCCCGGENCTEGQEGKCCCGGSEGSCCQPGEYCCSGVCEPAPCSTGCCCFCGTPNEEYGDQGSCEAAGGTWLEGESCTPNPCTDTPCSADIQCAVCVRADPPDSKVVNYSECGCPDGYELSEDPAVCCGDECVAPPSECPGRCDPANGDSPNGELNNTDCQPGECCIDYTCVSGCSCESNADCNGGYCCDGACQAEPGSGGVSISFGYGLFLSVLPCVEERRDIRAAVADAIEEALTNNGWHNVTREMQAIRDETSSYPSEPPTYEVNCQGCSGHGDETLPISDCYALLDIDRIDAGCCGTVDYDNPVSYDDEGQLIEADWPRGVEYDAVIYPCVENPLP